MTEETTFEARYDLAVRCWVAAHLWGAPEQFDAVRNVVLSSENGVHYSTETGQGESSCLLRFETSEKERGRQQGGWVSRTIDVDGTALGTFVSEVCAYLEAA